MPRGEQKNLKYIKEKSWIRINVNGEQEDFRIKDYEFDTRTLKTEVVRHHRTWDSYERGIGAKKKVYAVDSGLKSAYTVTYPLGNHDIWTKHYLEDLEDDIEKQERIVTNLKKDSDMVDWIISLKNSNENKIEDLCNKRNEQELRYEKIISYEIPVRHRVFLSPYKFEADKYGIGPLNKLKGYKTPEVLYSMNPQQSIANIRNDKERIERSI